MLLTKLSHKYNVLGLMEIFLSFVNTHAQKMHGKSHWWNVFSPGTYLMSDILAIVGDIIQRMRWDFGWRFADTCRHLKAPWRHLEGSLRTLADTLKTPWRHLLINAKVGRRLQPPHHGCLQGSPKGWIEHSNGDSAWDMSRTVTWTWHRSTRQIITDDHLIVV